MEPLSILMFVFVGLVVGHVASKVTGYTQAVKYFSIGVVGAVAGGSIAALMGMTFYGILGHMVVGAVFAIILILVSRRLAA